MSDKYKKLTKFQQETKKAIEAKKAGENITKTQREINFMFLMEPIEWGHSSGLSYRQNHVCERRKEVHAFYPFFNDYEKVIADEWLESEKHLGLWD